MGKTKKPRKALTLHKHYLVDIRRFASELGLTEANFGSELETKVYKSNGKTYLRLRVI